MGKISRRWARLRARFSKRTFTEAIAVFVVLVSFLSAAFSLIPGIRLAWRASLAIFVLSLASAFGWAVARTRREQLPLEIIPAESSLRFHIATVTESDLVAQVHDLASTVYPGFPAIPLDRYEQWLMVNPNILVCQYNRQRELVGYFDVFPLRADFLSLLAEGTCDELDIRKEHILSPEEAAAAPRLYLAGIAVRDADSVDGKWHANTLLWGLEQYLAAFYGAPNDREILAAGATPSGEGLLRRLGFRRVVSGRKRKDGAPFYSATMDSKLFRAASGGLRDWSETCTLGWIPKVGAGHRTARPRSGSRRRRVLS